MRCSRHDWATHKEAHKNPDYFYSVSVCRVCGTESRSRVKYMTQEAIDNCERLRYEMFG